MEKKIITGDEPSMPRDGIFDKDFLGRGSATGYRVEPQTGLTIRQHFAAMALQGILANPEGMAYLSASHGEDLDTAFERLAAKSVKLADALITALNK